MLRAAGFERGVGEPTSRTVSALGARHPGIPLIGFPRGAGTNLRRYAEATGVDAVGLDAGVAPAWATRELPRRTCLQGNLDPLLIAMGGEAMDAATREILQSWRERAFVFNLGHGITPDVPVENVERLSALLRAWRREEAR